MSRIWQAETRFNQNTFVKINIEVETKLNVIFNSRMKEIYLQVND